MIRYKLKYGKPTRPPQSGWGKDGNAYSGFDRLIDSNEEFARANGYYPLATDVVTEGVKTDTAQKFSCWKLENEKWTRHIRYVDVDVEAVNHEN